MHSTTLPTPSTQTPNPDRIPGRPTRPASSLPRPKRRRPAHIAEPWWDRRIDYLAEVGRLDSPELPALYKRQTLARTDPHSTK